MTPHITDEAVRTLQGMATGQRSVVDGLLGLPHEADEGIDLDGRTRALVGLAALVAVNGAVPEHNAQVQAALRAGATAEDIVSVLVVVAPHVGSSRVVTAAAAIMGALGIDPESGTVYGGPPG